jgi:actin-related protein
MFCDDISGLVVQVGHLKSYIGWVGDETPSYQTDSYFYHNQLIKSSFALLDDFSASNELENGIITSLVANRRIKSSDAYCHFIWNLANKINANLSENALFLTTHTTDNSFEERKPILSTMFEDFKVPAIFFSSKNLTSLFASGRHTGIVVDSGAYFTEVSSVSQGHLLKRSGLTRHEECRPRRGAPHSLFRQSPKRKIGP